MILIVKLLRETCFACCLLAMPLTVFANEMQLDLNEVIKIAQENNPQIDIARQLCTQSKGILTQAKSGYLPHLSLGGALGRQHIENLLPDDTSRLNRASVNVYQLIYDFGNTVGVIDASRMNLEATEHNIYQIKQDIAFATKAAFYNALSTERLVTVEKQAVENYKKQLYRAEKYFDAGVRTKIDVTNASLKLSTANLSVVQAKANQQTAIVKLEQILGMQPNDGKYSLIHTEAALEQLADSKPSLPGTLDDHMATAFDHRPDFKALHALIKAAEAEIRLAKSDYYPSINARGGYDEFDSGLSSINDQWHVEVDLSWEIFSGFETDGKMLEANAKLQEVAAIRQDLTLSIRQEVTETYLRAEENRQGVDIANETLTLAQENFKMAEGRYEAGLNDMIEYDDAQLELTRAQSDLVVTYYTYLTTLARLARAVGVTPELPVSKDENREYCSY